MTTTSPFLTRLEPTDLEDQGIIDTLAELPAEQVYAVMRIVRGQTDSHDEQAAELLDSWPAEHLSRLRLMVEDTTDDHGLRE